MGIAETGREPRARVVERRRHQALAGREPLTQLTFRLSLEALSSGGMDTSSAGSAGSGPAGARRASGPMATPMLAIDTPSPGAGNISPSWR